MKDRYIVKINKNRCKGCSLCIKVCPKKILTTSSLFNNMGYHFIEVSKNDVCAGCKNCVIICPDSAIELYCEDGTDN